MVPMPNHIHPFQFSIDAWMDEKTLFTNLAGLNDHTMARAAWEVAKASYSMRLTFRNRMQILEVREDLVTGAKVDTAGSAGPLAPTRSGPPDTDRA